MATVFRKRVYANALPPALSDLAIVPANRKWILREFLFTNNSALGIQRDLEVRTADGVSRALLPSVVQGGSSLSQFVVGQVLEAGDVIRGRQSAIGMTAWITVLELPFPP